MLTAILPAGTTWRTLIAYQKLVASKLDAGIERALGGAVLAQGGFEEHAIYEWYNEQVSKPTGLQSQTFVLPDPF